MTADTARRHSPLEHFTGDFAAVTRATGGALRLAELPHLAQVNVRLGPVRDGGPAAEAARQALGLPLPLEPNTVTRGGGRAVLWLGPDEWLVVGPPDTQADTESRLRTAVREHPASVVDVSAQRTTLLVAGPRSRDLLAHGCALDLHPRAPGRVLAGRCAQTTLARTQVVLVPRHPARPGYWILVRSSYADHLARWLLDAAAEHLPAPGAHGSPAT